MEQLLTTANLIDARYLISLAEHGGIIPRGWAAGAEARSSPQA